MLVSPVTRAVFGTALPPRPVVVSVNYGGMGSGGQGKQEQQPKKRPSDSFEPTGEPDNSSGDYTPAILAARAAARDRAKQ